MTSEHMFDPGDHAIIEDGHLCHDCGKRLEEHAIIPKWLELERNGQDPIADLAARLAEAEEKVKRQAEVIEASVRYWRVYFDPSLNRCPTPASIDGHEDHECLTGFRVRMHSALGITPGRVMRVSPAAITPGPQDGHVV